MNAELLTGASWEERCDQGREAERVILARFLNAGWSVLPFGATRVGAPVPPLITPAGEVRPVDNASFHPDGRRFFAVEIKSKTELTALAAYGLDRTQTADDPWQQLQLHDKYAGPVLLAIWDRRKGLAIGATVPMLLSNGGPSITSNGKYWIWSSSIFLPLNTFLSM